jgi:hypothetical protein
VITQGILEERLSRFCNRSEKEVFSVMTLFIKEDAEDGLRSGTQDQELNFEYDYFEIFVISLSEDVREVFGYMN